MEANFETRLSTIFWAPCLQTLLPSSLRGTGVYLRGRTFVWFSFPGPQKTNKNLEHWFFQLLLSSQAVILQTQVLLLEYSSASGLMSRFFLLEDREKVPIRTFKHRHAWLLFSIQNLPCILHNKNLASFWIWKWQFMAGKQPRAQLFTVEQSKVRVPVWVFLIPVWHLGGFTHIKPRE